MKPMHRLAVPFAAALIALAGASTAAAQECLKADDKAEAKVTGTLTAVKFIHPGNKSRLQAYVIRLAKPVCADVTDMDSKVQRVNKIGRVQLSGELDERLIKSLMNKRVTVGGTLEGTRRGALARAGRGQINSGCLLNSQVAELQRIAAVYVARH
jgi:hypothetical protein